MATQFIVILFVIFCTKNYVTVGAPFDYPAVSSASPPTSSSPTPSTPSRTINDVLRDELTQLMSLVTEETSSSPPSSGSAAPRSSRRRRSAFVPVFSVLYFDLKRKGAKLHELTHENRQMISRLSHIVANNTFLSAQMSNRLAQVMGDDPAARQAFRTYHDQYMRSGRNVQRAVMASDDRYTRLVEGDGDIELHAMGQTIPISFLARPSLAFVAGCAFNLLTVLLCFFVACRYCRTRSRQYMPTSGSERPLTVNINKDVDAENNYPSKSSYMMKRDLTRDTMATLADTPESYRYGSEAPMLPPPIRL